MRATTGESGKRYNVLFGKDICADPGKYLNRLMEIDTDVYGGDDKGEDCVYVGDISGYLSRFGLEEDVDNPGHYVDNGKGVVDNIVAISDPDQDDKILGYVNYLTMNDDLYKEIIDPDIKAYLEDPSRRDDGITGEQLRPWSKTEPNNLFILSIAVDKQYQNGEAIKVLTNSFLQEMRTKQSQGYDVTSITCDTVSDHGEDAMKMFRCAQAVNDKGKPIILPAPESDESGHPVTVRICQGEDMHKLLVEGFDFNRERTGINRKVNEKDEKDRTMAKAFHESVNTLGAKSFEAVPAGAGHGYRMTKDGDLTVPAQNVFRIRDGFSVNAGNVVHGDMKGAEHANCQLMPATLSKEYTAQELVTKCNEIAERGWFLTKFDAPSPTEAAYVLISEMDNNKELNKKGFSLKLPDNATPEGRPLGNVTELYQNGEYLGKLVISEDPQKVLEKDVNMSSNKSNEKDDTDRTKNGNAYYNRLLEAQRVLDQHDEEDKEKEDPDNGFEIC